jgi:hypothetical protein
LLLTHVLALCCCCCCCCCPLPACLLLLLLHEQSAESLKEVRRLNKLLAALEAASAGEWLA